jgi:hypothetical protein
MAEIVLADIRNLQPDLATHIVVGTNKPK